MTEKLPTNGAREHLCPVPMARALISDVSSGLSLARACESRAATLASFFRALDRDEELRTEYAAAQRARAELLADQVVDIADDDKADPAHNRNKMQARQWLASKLYAAKFGDKLQVEIEQRVSLADALKEAQARVIPGSYQTIPDETPTRTDSSLPAYRATDSQSDSAPDALADLLS